MPNDENLSNTSTEHKTLKQTKRYEEDNLVIIENRTHDDKPKSYAQIYFDYKSKIQSGYNLSVDDVAEYLACSYQFVTKNIIGKIKHIRINEIARSCCFRYIQLHEDWLDEEELSYYNKRILFLRSDFYTYIKSQTIVSQQYKTLTYNDFDQDKIRRIKNNVEKYNSKVEEDFLKIKRISRLFDSVIENMQTENKPVEIHLSELGEGAYFPEKLFSLKSLKEFLNLNYNIDVYRFIESYGLKKYIVCNTFARYNAYEIETIMENTNSKFDVIKMDYISWLENVKAHEGHDKLIRYIEDKVLEMSIRLIK